MSNKMRRNQINNQSLDQSKRSSESPNRGQETSFAGLGKRAIGFIVDWVLASLLFALLIVLDVLFSMATGFSLMISSIGIYSLIFIGYFTVLESKSGSTIGKNIVDIRVTSKKGDSISFGQAAIRNVLRIVDGLPVFYIIGILSIAITEDSQRVGDLAAGTVVIEK